MNARAAHSGLRSLEWFFLLVGLVAIDCYVWINTSTTLYQAYQDWAFDQTLRGLTPDVPGFARDEWRLLLGRVPGVMEQIPAERPRVPPTSIGRLEIPRLQLTVMVREGADEGTLRRAVGHIPGTALPGRIGNVGLAGHRDTFFRPLRDIHKGDAIDLQTESGTYHYVVRSTEIVGPRDVGVLAASGGETLTLVTCYPFYYVGSAPKRFIVRAAQVAAIPPRPPQPGS
jgi:sortase A